MQIGSWGIKDGLLYSITFLSKNCFSFLFTWQSYAVRVLAEYLNKLNSKTYFMKKKLMILSFAVFGFMSCAQNQKGPDTGGARPLDERQNQSADTSINNNSGTTADSSNRQQ